MLFQLLLPSRITPRPGHLGLPTPSAASPPRSAASPPLPTAASPLFVPPQPGHGPLLQGLFLGTQHPSSSGDPQPCPSSLSGHLRTRILLSLCAPITPRSNPEPLLAAYHLETQHPTLWPVSQDFELFLPAFRMRHQSLIHTNFIRGSESGPAAEVLSAHSLNKHVSLFITNTSLP